MGFRWSNGRLVSDEEYREEQAEGMAMFFQLAAFLLPTIGLGYLGYWWGGKYVMLALGIAGGFLGYVLNSFLSKALAVLVLFAIVGGVIAGVGYVAFSWFQQLDSPAKTSSTSGGPTAPAATQPAAPPLEDIKAKILPGMSEDQVRAIAGQPEKVNTDFMRMFDRDVSGQNSDDYKVWEYSKISVYFEKGRVSRVMDR